MRHFSVPLEVEASVYIQARSLSEAQSKLSAVISRTIDVCDMHWFTNGPFGSRYLPELAFGTEIRVRHVQPDERLEEIEEHDLWGLVRSREENSKRCVLPTSRDWFGEGKLPIYAADVALRTACYVKANSLEAAQVFVEHLKNKRLDRYQEDRIFWDYGLLGASQIVLSPNMLVDRVLDSDVSGEEQLRLISMGDPSAVLSNFPDGSSAQDRELHSVAAVVRGLLRHIDGFDMIADQHAHEIASFLIDYRDKTIGMPLVYDWDY
ncbi:hypothetical protein [Rhizobium sp. Rhizsp82]|uniref:hypothetical protein n=1 Tax=Rhizobium sp. Rhizsp82 TaxID=3243057 RepID=UPI0039B4FE1A